MFEHCICSSKIENMCVCVCVHAFVCTSVPKPIVTPTKWGIPYCVCVSQNVQWLQDCLFVCQEMKLVQTQLFSLRKWKLNTWHPFNNFLLNCIYFPFFYFPCTVIDWKQNLLDLFMLFWFSCGWVCSVQCSARILFYLMIVVIEQYLIANFIFCIVFIGHFTLHCALWPMVSFSICLLLSNTWRELFNKLTSLFFNTLHTDTATVHIVCDFMLLHMYMRSLFE